MSVGDRTALKGSLGKRSDSGRYKHSAPENPSQLKSRSHFPKLIQQSQGTGMRLCSPVQLLLVHPAE